MTISFSAKTDLNLAVAHSFDMGTAEAVTVTPEAHRRSMGDFARLSFVRANWFVRVSGASGTATIRLKAGSSTLSTQTVDLASEPENYLKVAVDVSGLQGQELLGVEVECDTTGADGVVNSWLECEAPMIISA